MKRIHYVAALLVTTLQLFGESANSKGLLKSDPIVSDAADYVIVERGPHHRVWQKATDVPALAGQTFTRPKPVYVELGTGLHYRDSEGNWLESSDQIELLPQGGAAGLKGQHQAYLPADIYEGIIELVTSDGKRLKSRPLGISYFDGTNSVLFAELTHSVGQLLPTGNQVVWTNCFTDISADLVATYRISGFECDLVFRKQPPTPGDFGMDPRAARLQLLTEFFDTSEPQKETQPANDRDRLSDQLLTFGTMRMIRGRAFSVREKSAGKEMDLVDPQRSRWQAPVYKSWEHLEGRKFLIEELPFERIQKQFEKLTAPNPSAASRGSTHSAQDKLSATRLLPPSRTPKRSEMKIQVATTDYNNSTGVVLDYMIINGGVYSYAFQGDTTYFIASNNYFFVSGTLTIEGGTVVKLSPGSTLYSGAVNCKTEPYRPAVFTAESDDSAGEIISGSSGSPVGYYGTWILGQNVSLQNLRMSYLEGFLTEGVTLSITNIQALNCNSLVSADYTTELRIKNGLLKNVRYIEPGDAIKGEHCTIDECDHLTGSPLCFTNSLLISITNLTGSLQTNAVVRLTHNGGVFQSVGAGDFYLAANSPYRDAGTDLIDSKLLTALKNKTTYPPILFSNIVFTANTNLSPQAPLDIDQLDLGYHYEPLDYLCGGIFLTNATMTLTPGTSIGTFGSGYSLVGITIGENGKFESFGTPANPNRVVVCNTVQEQSRTILTRPAVSVWNYPDASENPILTRFTMWSVMELFTSAHFFSMPGDSFVAIKDCQFYGGYSSIISSVGITNCLFDRSVFDFEPQSTLNSYFRNNLMIGGTFQARLTNILIKDNLFDQTTITNWSYYFGLGTYDGGYNAFVTNCDRLVPTFATDIVLPSSPAYQRGPLGNFYYPTNLSLINADNLVNGGLVGLFHFTTTTNQAKEASSALDIGYHYVAVDANGNPIDTNGDGIPDYLQDANGNGIVDPGEAPIGITINNPTNGASISR
jgi:hypothetical protein